MRRIRPAHEPVKRRRQHYLEALLDRQVDGIIFTATRPDTKPPMELARLSIPVVYVFAEGPPESVTFIPDDAQCARLAVERLLASGRTRILHITGRGTCRSGWH